MAYKMVSPSHYPFSRENAKFFSEELIEYVLFDFGHIWKPERSKRDIQLRKVASFVFSPCIGRLVAYISRKYSAFVVMKSLKAWNYINFHRPSIRERLLCNEIVTFCTRHELEDDDLGLFTFLAIVTEYARLVITHGQEKLVDTVVDALSYCLTSKLPGGFVPTLDRLLRRTMNFSYPRNHVICDFDPKTQYISPASTDPMYTPKSEFESPIALEFHLPDSLHGSTPEDIVKELKARKVHRELFRRKMMTDRATQTDVKSDHSSNRLLCVVFRSDQADLAEKIEIKNENLYDPDPTVTFVVIETNDVSVQTWSSGEQFDMLYTEEDKAEQKKREQMSKGACSTSKYVLDLNVVIEKLKVLERLQVKGPLLSRTGVDFAAFDIPKSEDGTRTNEAKNLNIMTSTESVMDQNLDMDTDNKVFLSDPCRNPEIRQLSSVIKCISEKDANTSASFNDSQFESLDISTDDPIKIGDERYHKKDYSSDSQIGSLDASTRTLDESNL